MQILKNPYSISLTPETYANLAQWARFKNESIEKAVESIVRQFLEHQDFYEHPRQDVGFYMCSFKVKIYRALLIGPMNLGEIARRTGLKYETARDHLEALRFAGIVTEKDFGKIPVRFFSLNMESPLTQQIVEILKVWYDP